MQLGLLQVIGADGTFQSKCNLLWGEIATKLCNSEVAAQILHMCWWEYDMAKLVMTCLLLSSF